MYHQNLFHVSPKWPFCLFHVSPCCCFTYHLFCFMYHHFFCFMYHFFCFMYHLFCFTIFLRKKVKILICEKYHDVYYHLSRYGIL
jgi:hypothetical protein